jgi:hypothetical protein
VAPRRLRLGSIARVSTRTQIIGLALGRLALGTALLAAPRGLVGAAWIGRDAERSTSSILLRAVGARDVALALGTLVALRQGGALRPWLLTASIADATDVLATLKAGDAVPAQGRAAVGALGGGAFAQQLALARAVDA